MRYYTNITYNYNVLYIMYDYIKETPRDKFSLFVIFFFQQGSYQMIYYKIQPICTFHLLKKRYSLLEIDFVTRLSQGRIQ